MITAKEKLAIGIANACIIIFPWLICLIAYNQVENKTLSYVGAALLFVIYMVTAVLNSMEKKMYGKLLVSPFMLGFIGTIFIIGLYSGFIVGMMDFVWVIC